LYLDLSDTRFLSI